MKKILIASIFLSLGVSGGATAQNNTQNTQNAQSNLTFAQQLQAQNQAKNEQGKSTSNSMLAPNSGPGIYQNAQVNQSSNPLLASPSQNVATSQVPQQPNLQPGSNASSAQPQYQVQNGQVVANEQGQIQGQGQPVQGSALPPGAAMAIPPDSIPAPLPLMPNQSSQKQLFENSIFKDTAITPAQIEDLIRNLDARRRALAQLPNTAPRPVTGTILVSLNPGATPPLIRPYYGEVTSFVVVDSTGAPWPVENFRVGNAQLFSVNRLDGPQGSAFTIDALNNYGQSNLVLKLAGQSSPVVIDLVAGQKEQDARVEVRVDRRGPNAAAQGGAQLPQGTSSALLPVLDGVPPDGGRPLTISGDDRTRGWLMPDGTMIIRTPLKIISPASNSFLSSADGTNVYVFRQTPVLSGMYNNQFVSLQVTSGL